MMRRLKVRSEKKLRTACIQFNAGLNWKKNWNQAEKFLIQAAAAKADVAVLPENFILRSSEAQLRHFARENFSQITAQLKKIARQNRLAIVAGSMPEWVPQTKLTANTCLVFSEEGRILLKYRKMHLFDINLPGVQVRESRFVHPGKKPGFFKMKTLPCGVGICYDLRFPEYFRALSRKGAEILFIPANFTAKTGKTAWEVLLRARAIENQAYVVASGQCGRHPAPNRRSVTWSVFQFVW